MYYSLNLWHVLVLFFLESLGNSLFFFESLGMFLFFLYLRFLPTYCTFKITSWGPWPGLCFLASVSGTDAFCSAGDVCQPRPVLPIFLFLLLLVMLLLFLLLLILLSLSILLFSPPPPSCRVQGSYHRVKGPYYCI